MELKPIARIRTFFPTKFGLPRQSGLAEHLPGTVVFEPPYRDRNALRGLEAFSHIWLLWGFSLNGTESWSPTVRPPRLGGNTRVGVFASRSPFRPNPIGLSCVRLQGIEADPADGPVLRVLGADLADGTPIYDIKPYLRYADCRPEAAEGFAGPLKEHALEVRADPGLLGQLSDGERAGLLEVLAQDPRPGYARGDGRSFGFPYAGYEVRFRVLDGVLTLTELFRTGESGAAGEAPPADAD